MATGRHLQNHVELPEQFVLRVVVNDNGPGHDGASLVVCLWKLLSNVVG